MDTTDQDFCQNNLIGQTLYSPNNCCWTHVSLPTPSASVLSPYMGPKLAGLKCMLRHVHVLCMLQTCYNCMANINLVDSTYASPFHNHYVTYIELSFQLQNLLNSHFLFGVYSHMPYHNYATCKMHVVVLVIIII